MGSQDMVHGMGTIIAEDNSKRKAIYWRDRRVCFLDGEPNKRGIGRGGELLNCLCDVIPALANCPARPESNFSYPQPITNPPSHVPSPQNLTTSTRSELTPGCRLQLLGDEYVRDAGGAAAVVAATHREGRYRLRLDNGTEKVLRLDCERFRLLR